MRKIINFLTAVSVFALGAAGLWSCKRTDNSTAETGFAPHPQKVAKHEVVTLGIGSDAPNFNLPDVDGKFYTLNDFRDQNFTPS